MVLPLRYIVRNAAQRIVLDPETRQKAANSIRIAGDEAKRIAGEEDRARAAGRAFRRAMNRFRGDR